MSKKCNVRNGKHYARYLPNNKKEVIQTWTVNTSGWLVWDDPKMDQNDNDEFLKQALKVAEKSLNVMSVTLELPIFV